MQHVAQPFLAVDGLDDLVERAQFVGLRAHLRFAFADFLGAIGHDPFEPAALGAQRAGSDRDEPEDRRADAEDIQGVGPPGGVPRRRDDERVPGLGALVLVQIARPNAEPVAPEGRFV